MPTANITLRVDNDLLERIDRSALQHGQTRTDYVLSWLPDYYTASHNSQPPPRRSRYARHADAAAARPRS